MISSTLPEGLFTEEKFLSIRNGITYYTKNIDNYSCHVFIFELNSLVILNEHWQSINAIIAANFQSQLEVEIELWNIYIIFVVNDNVPREVKYKIEQDKYSSRKIVFDHVTIKQGNYNQSKENIIKQVENKLFYLQSKIAYTDDLGTSKKIIENVDINILEALKDYKSGNRIDQFYNNYFKITNGQ